MKRRRSTRKRRSEKGEVGARVGGDEKGEINEEEVSRRKKEENPW